MCGKWIIPAIIAVLVSGCSTALRIQFFNNQGKPVEVESREHYMPIDPFSNMTIYFPNKAAKNSDFVALKIRLENCEYKYIVNSADIFHIYGEYIYSSAYDGRIYLQLNDDKNLYLIPPAYIEEAPVGEEKLFAAQKVSFPVKPEKVVCEGL